ncbi:NACHT domain-containing protein [Acetobacter fabarum]|uniref:NACHT domain-containing protein n=1 Tax=Acetobacter fabarum TaxID=483199 RepID=A0A269XUH0_9PROT|nr:hypothetical protein [Acetobacter fabarum]PAK76928.1 hypothetical protein B8X00_12480 [Acetobacter fabarum]PEN22377.1 hypothetical protein CRM93_13270 [Acetobacter fabarum]
MALVLAAIALMRGSKLGWLDGVVEDVPVALTAETGGPGDDIGLELKDGTRVEIQAKKGLRRGDELWSALENLINGISDRAIKHGVLVVSADSSATIRQDLANDLILIGQGQIHTLSDIGRAWLKRMNDTGRELSACANIRIKTLYMLDSDGADKRTALLGLESICAFPEKAGDAYAHLYRSAIALQRSRGRWTLSNLVRLLRSHGIELREDKTPIGLTTMFTGWLRKVNHQFYLPASMQAIPIAEMLPVAAVRIPAKQEIRATASEALDSYYNGELEACDNNVPARRLRQTYEGAWLGRFRRLSVIVAGPGLGKSTLARRLAWENARDDTPVLLVSLSVVANAMRNGSPFEQALWAHGLDGSGCAFNHTREALRDQIVVIADGLDEARELRGEVAAGLAKFACGNPGSTLIVTTRPIGYDMATLAEWRHYHLLRPDLKKAPENLGRLIALGRGLPYDDANSISLAKNVLGTTPAAEAIGASPLLLGMAASLIIRDQLLPSTKPKLYQAMTSLFETRDATKTGLTNSFLVSRVLDIVGWELVHDPSQGWSQLERAACTVLATDLETTPYGAALQFAAMFEYWERAGVVERLQFGSSQLVSFTHRTFAEFAAARYLVEMGAAARGSLEQMVDDVAFTEVISFAGALGLGDEITQMFIDRRVRGVEGQFERALDFAGDRNAVVGDQKIVELVNSAFDAMASESTDRFSIGVALTNLAVRKPSLIVSLALARISAPTHTVRLAALACIARAKPEHFDAIKWISLLDDLTLGIVDTREDEITAIMRGMPTGSDVDLLHIVALAALRAQPVADMDEFVAKQLSSDYFTNRLFRYQVDKILVTNGLKKPEDDWKTNFLNRQPIFKNFSRITAKLNIAENKRAAELAAVVAAPVKVEVQESIYSGPQFRALQQLVGLDVTAESDFYNSSRVCDEDAVKEVIKALVSISQISLVALEAEARAVLDTISLDPEHSPLLTLTRAVDIPAPEWSRVATLKLDRERVEAAFHHGPIWLRHIAATLLAEMPGQRSDYVRLLDRSCNDELRYASAIVPMCMKPTDWPELFLDRALSGKPNGIHYLLDEVTCSASDLPEKTSSVVEMCLRSDISDVVEAAARLGIRWLKKGRTLNSSILEESYRTILEAKSDENSAITWELAEVATFELLVTAGLRKGEKR